MTEEQKIELLDRVVARLDELGADRMIYINEKYYFDPPFLKKFYEGNVPESQHKILTNEKGSFVMKFQDLTYDIKFDTKSGHTRCLYNINELFTLDPDTLK